MPESTPLVGEVVGNSSGLPLVSAFIGGVGYGVGGLDTPGEKGAFVQKGVGPGAAGLAVPASDEGEYVGKGVGVDSISVTDVGAGVTSSSEGAAGTAVKGVGLDVGNISAVGE
jgi:hypothetical protein